MDLCHSTTSPGESSNSSMKRFGTAPMSLKGLRSSAEHMLSHSNQVEQRRNEVVANDLNTTAANVFIKAQSTLSSHCVKFAATMDLRKHHYYWVRDRPLEWLVCHVNTFKENSDFPLTEIQLHHPRYSNVYRVVMSENKKYMYCSSCKIKPRKGMPCVHILSIINSFHAQMFHPRYLLAYNSWIYDKNAHVRSCVDTMKHHAKSHPRSCLVEGHFSPKEFELFEYGNGACKSLYNDMVGLEKMHADGVALLRGEELAKKYKISDNHEEEMDWEEDDDFDETVGVEECVQLRPTKKKKKSKGEKNLSTYKFLSENFSKDAMKEVTDDDELQTELIDACNKLVLEFKGKRISRMNIVVPSSSKLVSSSAETEISRSHARLKRGHEHHK